MPLHLTLHTQPDVPLEAEAITPDRFSGLSETQIADVPIMHGNRSAKLGDFFRVTPSPTLPPSASSGQALQVEGEVVLEGDLSRVKRIGEGMTQGRITIKGNVGMHLGAGMSGGQIIVEGDAGDWVGAEMQGGRIVVKGDAGHLVGSAYRGSRKGMLGGEIVVHGNAGAEVGNGMRRGLIAVGGDSGDFTGVNMLAGTIIVLGEMGWRSGAGMRRGSIISMRAARILPTFNFDCVYRPTFLRLYLRHLRALGLPIDDAFIAGRYRRWSGDMVDLGRGEILLMDEVE
jgi:formylmethanofuran dehydrogenase subunit C